MTNEEAIKILEDTAFLAYQNASLDEINEAVGMAVEALELKIPKKPVYQGKYAPYLCPTCGGWLSEHHGDGYFTCKEPDYCYNDECHQAIDWEEE